MTCDMFFWGRGSTWCVEWHITAVGVLSFHRRGAILRVRDSRSCGCSTFIVHFRMFFCA